MLIHLLANAGATERSRLCSILSESRERRTDGDVSWVLYRMDAHGSIDYARQVAHGLAGAAQHEFNQTVWAPSGLADKRFLEALRPG